MNKKTIIDLDSLEPVPSDDELDDFTVKGITRLATGDIERFKSGLENQLEGKENLQELHLNLLGKIFITAAAAWVIGKATNLKLRGTPQEINAVARALQSSRRFQQELQNPGASVESVMQKLRVKNMSAREFENVFGVKWPL